MDSSSEKSANLLGKRNQEDDLETDPILKKHKEESEDKETEEGLDKSRHFFEDVLFVANLSRQTKISHIIEFFQDVGKVVRVQLIVNHEGKHVGYGFVQFVSASEAKKALQTKNSEYMHDHKIVLELTNKIAPPPKFCIDHKVWYEEDYLPREGLRIEEEDDLEAKRNETPDFVEKVLFVANLSPQTRILNIINFFKNVGEVVRVRLIVNHQGKHVGYGFVQFPSANEANMALVQKNREYLLDHKIFLDVAKESPYPPRSKFNIAEQLCYEDYIRRKRFLIEEDETVNGLDETPVFVEAVAVRKKTLDVANLPCEIEISDIINYFKDVGEVVHVRRLLTPKGMYVDFSFVEFASANDAEKVLQKKSEYLHDHKITILNYINIAPRSKYCIDHKVWYKDYLRREGLLIEEDEAVDGLDENLDLVAVREKTIFIANLPCETEITNIIHFFKDVGKVVNIRLIVNHTGKHVGCCFVEFASVYEAEMALEKKYCKHTRKIFLDVVKIAPYPLRPKFNLVEKLWYDEDYIGRERLVIEEDETVEGLSETLDLVEAVPVRKKTLYIANLPFGSEISQVIDFFKDIGEVVHFRLIVTSKGKHVGYGFVEFASAKEAKKALQTKNGEYMDGRDIVLEKIDKIAPSPKYCIEHKVWYREDYLLQKPMMEETKPNLKKPLMEKFCGKKIIFSYDDDE